MSGFRKVQTTCSDDSLSGVRAPVAFRVPAALAPTLHPEARLPSHAMPLDTL